MVILGIKSARWLITSIIANREARLSWPGVDSHRRSFAHSFRKSTLLKPLEMALNFQICAPQYAFDSLVADKIGPVQPVVDPMNLKSMSIDKLSKLRSQIDAAISSKVIEARRTVQSQLGKLDRLSTNGLRSKGGGVRGPVAPKYRNPANPAETWAGRGLKPRWLAAALRSGKKLEDFTISALGKKIQVPKKTRKK